MKLYFILRESVVDKLETNGKYVILYHYSPTNIKGNYLKVKNKPGLQSSAEFKSWGKERLFFYTKKRDYIYDKGISTDYLYVCRIEKNKIYPINENPNKYKKINQNTHILDSYYKQSKKDGFTAWVYPLGGNKKVQLVVSFEDVEIIEKIKN